MKKEIYTGEERREYDQSCHSAKEVVREVFAIFGVDSDDP